MVLRDCIHCGAGAVYPIYDIVERIETRHGLRQLSYMKELGMGHDKYILIDLDNGGKQITAADAVKGLKPFVKE